MDSAAQAATESLVKKAQEARDNAPMTRVQGEKIIELLERIAVALDNQRERAIGMSADDLHALSKRS